MWTGSQHRRTRQDIRHAVSSLPRPLSSLSGLFFARALVVPSNFIVCFGAGVPGVGDQIMLQGASLETSYACSGLAHSQLSLLRLVLLRSPLVGEWRCAHGSPAQTDGGQSRAGWSI